MIWLFLFAAEVATANSPILFTTAGTPGEGRPQIKVMAAAVKLYATPSLHSEVIAHLLFETPAVVSWRGAFTRTKSPGVLELRSDTLATTHDFGDISHLTGTESWLNPAEVRFNQGDKVPYLFYMGEGFCVVRYQHAVMATTLCSTLFDSDSSVVLRSQPEYEMWFDISSEETPSRWLMLEPGVAEWICTEPYDCEESSGT